MTLRPASGVLAVALTALVVGSVVYMPQEALDTRKPVPENSLIVYSSRTPDLSALHRLFSFSALETNESGLSELFHTLSQGPLSVAVVPLGGRSARDTWIGVSALGPRAVMMRWQLDFFAPEFVMPARSYFAWPVWKVEHPDFPAWMRVRFALVDGLLIGAVSDNSHDIYYLLDVFDGRRPSMVKKGDG